MAREDPELRTVADQIRRFVRRKEVRYEMQEDMTQEMLLERWCAPTHSVQHLYHHAMDTLNPRHKYAGTRRRESAQTCSFDTIARTYGQDVCLPDVLLWRTVHRVVASWPAQPREVFTRLLRQESGRAIACALGVSESAISQVVRRWRVVLQAEVC